MLRKISFKFTKGITQRGRGCPSIYFTKKKHRLKIYRIKNFFFRYSQLDKVFIHNLAEEGSVEVVNYGIQIRGKNKLSTVSTNKSLEVIA